jgi:anthranilate synthase component 2
VILLIDNYDSFVHNLARYFERLGQSTRVVRNDAVTPADVLQMHPAAIVLSPGPCTPAEAGCSLAMVQELGGTIPILGVCLGHQAIAAALGGVVVRAAEPRHGRTSPIVHEGSTLLAGLPSPFDACRYHSLAIDESSLPADVRVTARAADDGCPMALESPERKLFGLQFHPESVLTHGGYHILANFLEMAGCVLAKDCDKLGESEHREPASTEAVPLRPVTF